MSRYRWWMILGPVTVAGGVSCGPSLPSAIPLGGEEDLPEQPEASGSAPRSSSEPSDAGENREGESTDEASDGSEDGDSMPAIVAEKPAARTEGDEGTECEPSDAKPPSCEALETGPCAEVFGKLCSVVAQSFEPGVATAAVTCLTEKNRHSQCEAVADCARHALEKACVKGPERPWCEGFLDRCPKVPGFDAFRDQSTCERARASLSVSALETLDACLGEGCDLAGCVEKLASDSAD